MHFIPATGFTLVNLGYANVLNYGRIADHNTVNVCDRLLERKKNTKWLSWFTISKKKEHKKLKKGFKSDATHTVTAPQRACCFNSEATGLGGVMQ